MNELPPASNPASQPEGPAHSTLPPEFVPPPASVAPPPAPQAAPRPEFAPPAPPLGSAAAPAPTTPAWMERRAAQGAPPTAPPPQYPGPAPIYPGVPAPGGAPADYKTAGVFMLIGSITTLICNLIVVLLLIWICIGVCWLPLLGLSIWALVCGVQAANGTRVRNIRIANGLGLVAALFSGDLVGVVMQILALVWLSKADVSQWIEQPA